MIDKCLQMRAIKGGLRGIRKQGKAWKKEQVKVKFKLYFS